MKKIKKIFFLLIILTSFTSCSSFIIKTLDFVGNKLLVNKDVTYEKYMSYSFKKEKKVSRVNREFTLKYKTLKNVKYYEYKKEDSENLLIYVHGGAFVRTRILQDHIRLMQSIKDKSKSNFEIMLLDYKGKKHPSQSKELDVLLNEMEKKYKKIILIGDSSGGNIIFSNTLRRRDLGKKLVDGIIGLSPWLDPSNRVKSRVTNFNKDILMGKSTYNKLLLHNPYLEGQNLTHPYVSPVYAKYYRFPKTLIQYGGLEILEDDSVVVCKKINKVKGNCRIEKYEGMIHVFQLFNIFDKTDIAISNIAIFIDNIFN